MILTSIKGKVVGSDRNSSTNVYSQKRGLYDTEIKSQILVNHNIFILFENGVEYHMNLLYNNIAVRVGNIVSVILHNRYHHVGLFNHDTRQYFRFDDSATLELIDVCKKPSYYVKYCLLLAFALFGLFSIFDTKNALGVSLISLVFSLSVSIVIHAIRNSIMKNRFKNNFKDYINLNF